MSAGDHRSGPTGRGVSLHFEIFLVSFAALLVEVSYTRVFSFKLSSYFTYLVIGFAMLGMGTGGVLLALVQRLREASSTWLGR